MKKIFLAIFLATLAIGLAACGNGGGKKENKITYAAWNLGNPQDYNIERRMINEFMVQNPGVEVEVIERPKIVDEEGNESDVGWNEFFASRAAIDDMPDVFLVSSVIEVVSNGWIEDVKDLAEADPDFLKVPENIRDSGRLGKGLYGLPSGMFYFGYFINRTVINSTGSGAVIPEYGITFDELLVAAEKNSKPATLGGDGISGIQGVSEIFSWLPAQLDETLGWYTYNEEGYHLDSEAFRVAMAETQKYFGPNKNQYSGYVHETQENTEDLYGSGDAFANGKQSIRFEGSFNIRGWVGGTSDPEHNLYGHDVDFIGTPSVMVNDKKVHRIPTIIDYIGVGKGTKNKELSYKFAKWMGFGVDGYKKRLEIAKNNPEAGAVNFAPLIKDQTLIDAYFELYPTMTEFRKIVETHDDFIVESLHKIVPGYVNSRWDGRYNADMSIANALDAIRNGELSLADALEAGLNRVINEEYQKAKTELDKILNK